MITLRCSGAAETRALGARLARLLRAGDVVLLIGPLGAGKTTFVQGLVRGLGGSQAVTSPTFTLVHRYEATPPVVHVDLWRLNRLQEVVDLALEEDIEEGSVVVLEWGEAAESLYGADGLKVTLEWGEDEDERVISFDARCEKWSSRLEQMDEVAG